MQYKPAIWSFMLCVLVHSTSHAQSVLYSSSAISNDVNTRFEVIGRAGTHYWVYKSKKNTTYKKGSYPWPPEKEISFEVYDGRLHHVKEIKDTLSDSVLKQYLITQRYSFDQLLFRKEENKTSVVVNRFTQEGEEAVTNAQLLDFPGEMAPEDFLVTRSPDRTKILLLGFALSTDLTPSVYARIYSKDWALLHQTVYKEGNLLQPTIQYEFTEYPLEASDAAPVKITNNGDWLMVAAARRKNAHLLFHFKREDSSLVQTDINQLQTHTIESISLSVEEGKDAYIGVLENMSDADKRLRMIQYSLAQHRLGYDTMYNFHLPNVSKRKEYYLFEQEFIQIPGKGFMYMKEYGRRYFISHTGEAVTLEDEQEYAAHGSYAAKVKPRKQEYIRNSSLSDTRKEFDRGDLSLRFFPFHPTDSSWAGLLHVEQNTQLKYSYLSYACVPSRDKIIFLYNVLANNENKLGSSTVLDHKGQSVDEGPIFWRATNVLDFQKARLIDSRELFVPFEKNRLQGFAIIRF